LNQSLLGYPVIIIGAHRSGTSLLASLLNKFGVYMGADLNNVHYESQFFLNLNRRIFRIAHATWDNPCSLYYLLNNNKLCDLLVIYLKRACSSLKTVRFQGWINFIRNRFLGNLKEPWGWKDPQNTFTLSLWLKVFPQARIINIYRNGIDVAFSLQQRELRRIKICGFKNPLISVRCLSLEGAFQLWTEYIEMSLAILNSVESSRIFSIKYESFIQSPIEILKRLLNFLELDLKIDSNYLRERINVNRAYAFRSRIELINFYKKKMNHPLIIKLGYDNIKI